MTILRLTLDQTALRAGGRYREVKDPCPVLVDGRWQLYGTGVLRTHGFEVFHASAEQLSGPWELHDPIDLGNLTGSCLAAPGVITADDGLHMFLQTAYNEFGSRIEHLVSRDGGETFAHEGSALQGVPGTPDAGIYDPHPALVDGMRYLAYSAFHTVGRPDIHLARSDSWNGPWERLGPILEHAHVGWHNQLGAAHYEWGLEGAQLLQLPDGRVLLNAVGFLGAGSVGHRQRLFLALADSPLGPYDVGAPVLPTVRAPLTRRRRGENGHATALVVGEDLLLFFQERDGNGEPWRLGLAGAPLAELAGNTAEVRGD